MNMRAGFAGRFSAGEVELLGSPVEIVDGFNLFALRAAFLFYL